MTRSFLKWFIFELFFVLDFWRKLVKFERAIFFASRAWTGNYYSLDSQFIPIFPSFKRLKIFFQMEWNLKCQFNRLDNSFFFSSQKSSQLFVRNRMEIWFFLEFGSMIFRRWKRRLKNNLHVYASKEKNFKLQVWNISKH